VNSQPAAIAPDVAQSAAYDELPDGVLVTDSAGTVLLLNSAGARLLGRGSRGAVGCPVREVLPLVTRAGDDWWSCIERASLLPRSTRQPERLLSVPAAPGSGNGADLDLTVAARWIKEDGRLVRTVVTFRDTVARVRAERSSADLVSTVAHELRSPLTSVKGFTATLLAKWDRFPDDQKKLMLQTVNADADRVTRLLSELLDVSRIDAGRLEIHRQVVDVGAAVRKAVAGRVASGEPPERFQLHESGPLPELWLDPDKVDQVVGNLVENAVRHGDGGVVMTLAPLLSPTSGAELTVADHGDGVADDVVGRVFTKFWRGGQRRGGTGLGLYIVKGLVEAHGGSVTAGRSATTGGAEFRVVLPAGNAPYDD